MIYRPVVLDLFCGAGGAAEGLRRAGFDTIGVDIKDFPDYPGKLVECDLSAEIPTYLYGYGPEHGGHGKALAAIWASPPCQRWSVVSRERGRYTHPDYIKMTREACVRSGLPYVIENVPDAPIRPDLVLCGEMFPGLRVIRHRHFEIGGFTVTQPMHQEHKRGVRGYYVVAGQGQQPFGKKVPPGKRWLTEASAAMGITHMKRRADLVQAVPPAYSEYIGQFLMESIQGLAA